MDMNLGNNSDTPDAARQGEALDTLLTVISSVAITVLLIAGVVGYPIWLAVNALVVIHSSNPDLVELLTQAQLVSGVSCALIITICFFQWWRKRTYVYGIVVTAIALPIAAFIVVTTASIVSNRQS